MDQALPTATWLAVSGARLIARGDAEYPLQLASVPGAPAALFVLGNAALLARPQIAIVGSRAPTAAGRRIAATLARDLVAAGYVITSGLARGIDAAAHEAALDAGGTTIAVCGTGLDTCYPRQNQALFDLIARHGALVSEFPPGTQPRAFHFPRRNRVISGLARGVVVVEAAAGSGSLITADHAAGQGRDVFAVPGSPLNPLAAGCNELIRNGAVLVRSAADVLAEAGFFPEQIPLSHQPVATANEPVGGVGRLDKDYEMLLDALGFEPASIDDLVDRTGLAAGSVASMMLILELDGRVEARPGALYNRVQ
ncbi:MAG TPA: DNA-processing protein DprA [Steroidobacteraceae bacterium]|nr:DNA-processing protein DprA [Steroidobacteraceae bacterium]